MQGVLFFESFSFCSRNDLEFLQPISQSLFDIVVNGSKVLPLRPISVVSMVRRQLELSSLFCRQNVGHGQAENKLQVRRYSRLTYLLLGCA